MTIFYRTGGRIYQIAFLLVFLGLLASCGGGGGGRPDLGTNACGTLGLATRIVNGTACSTAGSPVVPLVLMNSDFTSSLCSGTLITPEHLLTAGHCFREKDVLSAYIEANGVRVYGRRARVHPDYVVDPSSSIAYNDAAVLELESSVALPTVPILQSQGVFQDDVLAIFGFGLDQNDSLGVLRSGEVRVDAVTNTHIVTQFQGEGSTTCNGDSGGPAILAPSDRADIDSPAIAGIVSSGTSKKCSTGDVAFFTNLVTPSMTAFIEDAAPGVRFE